MTCSFVSSIVKVGSSRSPIWVDFSGCRLYWYLVIRSSRISNRLHFACKGRGYPVCPIALKHLDIGDEGSFSLVPYPKIQPCLKNLQPAIGDIVPSKIMTTPLLLNCNPSRAFPKSCKNTIYQFRSFLGRKHLCPD